MARVSRENRHKDMILANAGISPENDTELKICREAVSVADARSFPVNMREAITNLSLNDAAMIGYLRGVHDTVKATTHKKHHQNLSPNPHAINTHQNS